MRARRFVFIFAVTTAAAIFLLALFNVVADRAILKSPQIGSLETVSGFERTMKPVWLESLGADVVAVGSSRVRDGFDPTLIARQLHPKVFNDGLSSITPYELKRLVQNAAAEPSTRAIVVPLDTFMEPGMHATLSLSGFDEQTLAVTPSGAPTPQRGLWLMVTRDLSGGATAMHALSLYLLAQLGGESAAMRSDLFTAYREATNASLSRDLAYRSRRVIHMQPWQRAAFKDMLSGLCTSKVDLYLFFPPDSWPMQKVYAANDAAGVATFKRSIEEDVESHNAHCKEQAQLFDFLLRTPVTDPPTDKELGENYSDAIHFRPPVGTRLLAFMLGSKPPAKDSGLGVRLSPR